MARHKATKEAQRTTRLPEVAGTSKTAWPTPATEAIPERYTRDVFEADLEMASRRVSLLITSEISKDPKEAEKLRRSLKQARSGKTMPWRDADDDT